LEAARIALAAKWISICGCSPAAGTIAANEINRDSAHPLAAREVGYITSLMRKTGRCRYFDLSPLRL